MRSRVFELATAGSPVANTLINWNRRQIRVDVSRAASASAIIWYQATEDILVEKNRGEQVRNDLDPPEMQRGPR